MYHSDDPIVSYGVSKYKSGFTVGGAWKLAADPAPSGGIHSCTFEPHNSQTGGTSRISGRYGIIYRFRWNSTVSLFSSL